MTYKQQRDQFNKVLKDLDIMWNDVVTSNINNVNGVIVVLIKNFINELNKIFTLASYNQLENVINEFPHILEIKFGEFYSILNE
jgi:hypothetical protein